MNTNFQTPILLISFNRPVHTQQVFEEIKKQKPRYLFVFQDGARLNNIDDVEKCANVRSIFSENIDWDCEFKSYYSDSNLGCGNGPVTGINWFFDHVEKGIIMEDDCYPHTDFFSYCEELLTKYQENNEVMVIGATTYYDNYPCQDSYLFTRYFTGGAWATWRRAWNGFSLDLENIETDLLKKIIRNQFYSSAEINWWVKKTKEIKKDTSKKDYWDYQMQINLLYNNGLAVRPKNNLISNIGFDDEGTHTLENDSRGERKIYSCFPLIHPLTIAVNKKNDYLFMAKEHQKRIDKRIIFWMYNLMFNSNGLLNKLLFYYKKRKKAWKNR